MKKLNDYNYKERLEKFGSITFLERRMREEQVESFKIINEISNYGW